MRSILCFLLIGGSLFLFAQSAEELPFQILIAKGATIYGEPVEPLRFVDDVTSIEVGEGGFVSLIHKGGTTYEHLDKIFTFYLKPDPHRNYSERPILTTLYQDSASLVVAEKSIFVLYPPFDRSGYLEWNEREPLEVFWKLPENPTLSFIVSVLDGDGNKIQDFRTQGAKYLLKPETYGLTNGLFAFKIKSSFAGETIESKTYTVQLVPGEGKEEKATDLILKALYLEANPVVSLPVWTKALSMKNGEFYKPLFVKFLTRHQATLTAAGEDVELLLSQNK